MNDARGQHLLTHSRMACAKTCLRKHQFAYELGIRRDRASAPLRMGAAVHVGLDALNSGRTVEESADQATESYAITPDWCVTDEQITDWCVEAEVVKRLVYGYAWRWADDAIQCIATEQLFEIPLINPDTGTASRTFVLAGKIDKIARLPDGRLAIVEHKTCGEDLSPDSDFWLRLRMDQQISLYMIAARELGYDVATVLYDVIRKPSIRPRKLTKAEQKRHSEGGSWYGEPYIPCLVTVERETVRMFGTRLTSDITSRPDFYFDRQEIPRLNADLDEFRYELWQIAANLRECRNHGRWYRNTNACLHPYKCEYFNICTNGVRLTDLPDGFVQLDFVHPELQELSHADSNSASESAETVATS